jgi:excisionase family DNA binding protein
VKEDKPSKVVRHNVHREPLLDINEAAEYLNLSSHTVRAIVRQRKITFVKLGARVLLRSQDLEEFINSNLIRPLARKDDQS